MIRFRDMFLRDPTDHDIDFVCRRMRPGDRREVYGVRFSEEAEDLARMFKDIRGAVRAFHAAGVDWSPTPIALFGVWEHAPGVGTAQLIATADFPKIVRPVGHYIRNILIPTMIATGLHRVQVHALADLEANCRWIEMLGAQLEVECAGMGKEGQTYNQYVWLKKEIENVRPFK